MDTHSLFYTIFLWWSVTGMSIWAGGTIFSMSVAVLMLNYSPPDSGKIFFGQTSFNKYIWNFFGPPFMAIRNLPLFITLFLGWNLRPQGEYLVIASACTLFGIIYTLAYVYRINDVLMTKAGGKIKSMVNKWIFC